MPASHAVQLAAPAKEDVPASQSLQLAAPSGEYFPAAHAVQAPPLVPYVPATHSVQVVSAAAGSELGATPVPGAQHTAAPSGELVPEAQLSQVVAPLLPAYVPLGQRLHVLSASTQAVPRVQSSAPLSGVGAGSLSDKRSFEWAHDATQATARIEASESRRFM